MKNLYTWIVAAMVCFGILPMAAQDQEVRNIQFSVNVPSADAVRCTVQSQDYPLTDGVNKFDLPEGSSLYFVGRTPWRIKSVKNKAGQKPDGFYDSDWYVYANESNQDEEFTIEVVNIDDLRTAEFTINVDDPSLVSATVNGYYTQLNLQPGLNTLKYQPNVETYVNISPANPSVPLYSVKKNGVAVAPQGNTYGIALSPGCEIDVVAILPDEDRTVSFSYSNGAENSITVKVNDQEVPDFNGKNLTVKLGSQLSIIGDLSAYKFEKLSVNNEEISFSGNYTFPVMKNSDVYISARPYSTITASITVNSPDLITITSNGTPINLTAGYNTITLPENQSTIMWNVAPTGVLKSVTVNGKPLSTYQSSYTLNNGDAMAFELDMKVLDMAAVVWVDNHAGKACSNYLDLNSQSDRSVRYTFEDGYNIMDFYSGMNPFSLNWNGYDADGNDNSLSGQAYLNDRLLESPNGPTSVYYSFSLANGDVLKLFMDSTPVICNVAFDIPDGVSASVVKDIMSAVENPAAGFECFAGTQVKITGNNLKVEVNGKELQADADPGIPSYTFTVEEQTTAVSVMNADGNGVNGIDSVSEAINAFDILGRRISPHTPGLQIRNGRKVIVKP